MKGIWCDCLKTKNFITAVRKPVFPYKKKERNKKSQTHMLKTECGKCSHLNTFYLGITSTMSKGFQQNGLLTSNEPGQTDSYVAWKWCAKWLSFLTKCFADTTFANTLWTVWATCLMTITLKWGFWSHKSHFWREISAAHKEDVLFHFMIQTRWVQCCNVSLSKVLLLYMMSQFLEPLLLSLFCVCLW